MLPEIDKEEAGVDLALTRRPWMKNQDSTSPSAEISQRLCIGALLRMTQSRRRHSRSLGYGWTETGWINLLLKDSRTGIQSLWPLWESQRHDIPNYLECNGQSITQSNFILIFL